MYPLKEIDDLQVKTKISTIIDTEQSPLIVSIRISKGTSMCTCVYAKRCNYSLSPPPQNNAQKIAIVMVFFLRFSFFSD